MFLEGVRFLNGGYCRQFARFTGVRSWKSIRFHAVFVHFRHPIHGECLIDTGYGPEYHREVHRWPWRVLNWIIPVPRDQDFARKDYLLRHLICPDNIGTIFLSHFHADHIGGAKQFPRSRFVFRQDAFTKLSRLPDLGKLKQGFIPGLLPVDFVDRGLLLEEEVFQMANSQFAPISSYDYFGDGSLIVLDLPGHALGHTGYLLSTVDRQFLYVVDAYWNRDVFRQKVALPRPARYTVNDWPAYNATLDALSVVSERLCLDTIACHCPMTQELVTANAN